jgi:hypothetical protein
MSRRTLRLAHHARSAAAAAAAGSRLLSSSSLTPAQVEATNTIQLPLSQLWLQASTFHSSAQAEDGCSFIRPQKLQHSLTSLIELGLRRKLVHESGLYHQTILTALKAPGCSAWITTLPTLPVYRMSDASMRLAVRHRLGLLPFDSLVSASCTAPSCTSTPSFLSDPDHFHSCQQQQHTSVMQRHNNIVQVLMDLGVRAGYTAIREPNDHIRPQVRGTKDARGWNEHADILLLKNDERLYIDVSLTRPTAPSFLVLPQSRQFVLHAAAKRSVTKHRKYDELARVNSYQFFAFCMETYGGLVPEGVQLLKKLAKQTTGFESKAALRHAQSRLSVTLQSANATIAEQGAHTRSLDQYRAGGAASKTAGIRFHNRSKIGTFGMPGPTAASLQRKRTRAEALEARDQSARTTLTLLLSPQSTSAFASASACASTSASAFLAAPLDLLRHARMNVAAA